MVSDMTKGKGNKKKNSKKHHDAYNTFVDFSKDMTEKINEITREGANEYKDLYNTWSEYAQKMTDKMAQFTPEDEGTFKGVQKVWKDYSEMIGDCFYDIMNRENGPYKELYQTWTDYTSKMGEQLSDLMSESFKEQQDLYELWMDSFGMKDMDHDEDLARIYKNMNQFWLDVWQNSKGLFQPVPENDMNFSARYKELNDLWTKAYSKMVMNIIKSPEFAEMDGNILNTNLDMIKANDQLMNQYLNAMGLPTKESISDIYLKLHDLDRKISEIARAVNSKGKK
jgi:hypothetical protein